MKIKVLSNVYPPAEDSWQTAELLRWVVSNHVGNEALRIVDVGSGTGVLTLTALEEAVNRGGIAWVLPIDHDVNASVNTRLNLVNNDLYQYADVITANLLDAIRVGFRIDILVSNPPYLPGNWDEDWRIFGGPRGNEVIKQLIRHACSSSVSTIILTQSSLSNWEESVDYLGRCGFKLIMIKATHYFFEDIITMVFERIT
ncbi:class I SAM-dependent methyltransferase [Vulcanisaeta sp. JCM 16161]|uniref:methyltransferase n=1 Tax=Vulcanisaeta sp. JCM 16161 TaxID=1295372 RepID=UPI0006D252D9|nr:methyltransferase [Vulcanisaeta sp. JCM 16161]